MNATRTEGRDAPPYFKSWEVPSLRRTVVWGGCWLLLMGCTGQKLGYPYSYHISPLPCSVYTSGTQLQSANYWLTHSSTNTSTAARPTSTSHYPLKTVSSVFLTIISCATTPGAMLRVKGALSRLPQWHWLILLIIVVCYIHSLRPPSIVRLQVTATRMLTLIHG